MKFTYVGPHDEVEIPSAGVVCKRGETVEVPDSLAGNLESGKPGDDNYQQATGLLAQPDNWQPAKAAPVKKES